MQPAAQGHCKSRHRIPAPPSGVRIPVSRRRSLASGHLSLCIGARPDAGVSWHFFLQCLCPRGDACCLGGLMGSMSLKKRSLKGVHHDEDGLVIYHLPVTWPAPRSPVGAPHGRGARGSIAVHLPLGRGYPGVPYQWVQSRPPPRGPEVVPVPVVPHVRMACCKRVADCHSAGT